MEGLGKLKKNPPHPGLEPATFRLVAQCLNQLRYRVAPVRSGNFQIEIENTATPKYWVKI
jgi:hypothetical protein